MTQRKLPLIDSMETRQERCQRSLGGVVGVTAAAAKTFKLEVVRQANWLATRVDERLEREGESRGMGRG